LSTVTQAIGTTGLRGEISIGIRNKNSSSVYNAVARMVLIMKERRRRMMLMLMMKLVKRVAHLQQAVA
jgi:hypothetical protein